MTQEFELIAQMPECDRRMLRACQAEVVYVDQLQSLLAIAANEHYAKALMLHFDKHSECNVPILISRR